MGNANAVAQFLLHLAEAECEPELVTHLRLQKLLYYAQGWSIALRGQPLFRESIEAWANGPVVREVYREYADFKNQPISETRPVDSIALNRNEKDFVRSIWEHYKVYSAWKLREMTHQESPWLHARGDCREEEASQAEIEHGEMLRFFESEHAKAAPAGLDLERIRRAEAEQDSPEVKSLDYLTRRLQNAV